MVDAEREAGRHWPCVNALYEMFFSDVEKYVSDEISPNDIRSLVATNLSGSKVTNPYLDDQDNVLIGKKVDALLEIEPGLKFQRAMSRISWYRFGFCAQLHQVALSNNFVKYYGRWRLRLSLTGESYTVCDFGLGVNKTPTRPTTISNTAFKGYTMDRFFHCADSIRIFSDKVEWKLVRVGCDTPDKNKSISKIRSPKRTIERIVGSNSYVAIEKCISIAARDEEFLALKNKKSGGRYLSTVTRKLLAELLKGEFRNQLNCSVSTLHRALSDFVSCPRARR